MAGSHLGDLVDEVYSQWSRLCAAHDNGMRSPVDWWIRVSNAPPGTPGDPEVILVVEVTPRQIVRVAWRLRSAGRVHTAYVVQTRLRELRKALMAR